MTGVGMTCRQAGRWQAQHRQREVRRGGIQQLLPHQTHAQPPPHTHVADVLRVAAGVGLEGNAHHLAELVEHGAAEVGGWGGGGGEARRGKTRVMSRERNRGVSGTAASSNEQGVGATSRALKPRSPAAVAAVDGGVDLHAQQLGGAVGVGGHLDAAHHAARHRDLRCRGASKKAVIAEQEGEPIILFACSAQHGRLRICGFQLSCHSLPARRRPADQLTVSPPMG